MRVPKPSQSRCRLSRRHPRSDWIFSKTSHSQTWGLDALAPLALCVPLLWGTGQRWLAQTDLHLSKFQLRTFELADVATRQGRDPLQALPGWTGDPVLRAALGDLAAAWLDAALVAVPTMIAGIYGMNFIYMPELQMTNGYFMVLVVVTAAFGVTLWTRVPAELDIVRDRGSLFRETDEGLIENTYTLKIINKSQQDQTFVLSFTGLEQASWIGEKEITIKGGDTAGIPISLSLDPADAKKPVMDIEFQVRDKDEPEVELTQGSKFFAGR